MTNLKRCDKITEKNLKGENMKKKSVITKDMTIGEVLKVNEKLGEVFLGFGMHCLSCPVSQMETIEEASMVHGVDVEFLLKKLNENA